MSELHKSAKGKVVDMNRLASQNELTVAVSNIKVNARGDELGPGGQIIRNQQAESAYVGVPVEQYNAKPVVSRPAATPYVPPASQVISTPVLNDTPNALVQPIAKEEKFSKGKQ
jgi:hypothetical protein